MRWQYRTVLAVPMIGLLIYAILFIFSVSAVSLRDFLVVFLVVALLFFFYIRADKRWLFFWSVLFAPLAFVGMVLTLFAALFLAELMIDVDWLIGLLWFASAVLFPGLIAALLAKGLVRERSEAEWGRRDVSRLAKFAFPLALIAPYVAVGVYFVLTG